MEDYPKALDNPLHDFFNRIQVRMARKLRLCDFAASRKQGKYIHIWVTWHKCVQALLLMRFSSRCFLYARDQ